MPIDSKKKIQTMIILYYNVIVNNDIVKIYIL
jgi:hypothetical protein